MTEGTRQSLVDAFINPRQNWIDELTNTQRLPWPYSSPSADDVVDAGFRKIYSPLVDNAVIYDWCKLGFSSYGDNWEGLDSMEVHLYNQPTCK